MAKNGKPVRVRANRVKVAGIPAIGALCKLSRLKSLLDELRENSEILASTESILKCKCELVSTKLALVQSLLNAQKRQERLKQQIDEFVRKQTDENVKGLLETYVSDYNSKNV